jgi:hypothetical protein
MTDRRRFLLVALACFVSFWAGRALPTEVPFTVHRSTPDDRPLCDPCGKDGLLINNECRNDASLWICEEANTSDGKVVVMCRPNTDKCPRRDA